MRILEDNLTERHLKRACPHGPTILLLEFTRKKHLLCRGYQFPPYVFPTAYVVTESLAAWVRLHFPAAHEAKCDHVTKVQPVGCEKRLQFLGHALQGEECALDFSFAPSLLAGMQTRDDSSQTMHMRTTP